MVVARIVDTKLSITLVMKHALHVVRVLCVLDERMK